MFRKCNLVSLVIVIFLLTVKILILVFFFIKIKFTIILFSLYTNDVRKRQYLSILENIGTRNYIQYTHTN